jgi:hypothetical protein
MKITITDNDGVIIDTINVEEECGDIMRPLPASVLVDRVRDAKRYLDSQEATT